MSVVLNHLTHVKENVKIILIKINNNKNPLHLNLLNVNKIVLRG